MAHELEARFIKGKLLSERSQVTDRGLPRLILPGRPGNARGRLVGIGHRLLAGVGEIVELRLDMFEELDRGLAHDAPRFNRNSGSNGCPFSLSG